MGEIWADLLGEETLAKVWPGEDGKECTQRQKLHHD